MKNLCIFTTKLNIYSTSVSKHSYPILNYDNADSSKDQNVKTNTGNSGIYRWVNKNKGKSYIGSSVNLGKRFTYYYSFKYLNDPKNKMLITKALLKFGYSNFSLEILEYCNKSDLIIKEQFYFYNLKPEYNILSKARSSLGFKHSEKTRLKMSLKSPEHLNKIK